jgi:hypothetical protein
MKHVLICILIFKAFNFSAQIKKKDLGTYKGNIPSYQINNGSQLLEVASCNITVFLYKENLKLVIGSKTYSGGYAVKKIKRRAYDIHLTTPHSQIEEVFRLDGKERKMLRKGIFPQPDCQLIKL